MKTAWGLRQQPLTTDRRMRRLLRFIGYNTDLYVRHRDRGEYKIAVERLQRLTKLIALVERISSEGSEIAPLDWVNIRLLQRHIGAMLPGVATPGSLVS